MKALVWYGEQAVCCEDAPDPEPAAGGVVFVELEVEGIRVLRNDVRAVT